MLTLAAQGARANPQDGIVSAGNATISSSGSTLNIRQSTNRAVIDWRSFDIGAGETTRFYQPSSGSITLNRVNSSSPSFIDGNLIANGNVFIVNQNGVLFGQNSRIDVNGLVATTANITNTNFMNGNLRFDQAGNPDATIENRGVITAGEAGLVGLVAPNVLNSGIIHAKLGRVHLASGDTATVDLYGDGLIEVGANDYANQRVVENTGKITAEGGTIAMTAAAGAHMVNSLIRVSGELHAPSVGVKNGKIIIGAEGSNAVSKNVAANKGKKTGSSTVIVDGVLDVSGKKPGEKSGQITITADHIAIKSAAVLDATGDVGGGTVHIGGEYLGKGDTPTATYTIVQTGSLIDASALTSGNGGEVIVYSDKTTEFGGTIIADGSGETGNGGFAETSGRDNLLAMGTVQLRAGRRGRAGTWLLDPADITITSATNTSITGSPNFTATGTASQVSAASIKSLLDAGTNVTITTSNDAYTGNGDIIVASAITTTGLGSLKLSAFRNITISSAITLQGGSLTLRADNTGIGNGSIVQSSSGAIATNGGNITMGGGSGVISAGSGYATGNTIATEGISIASTVSAGGGNIIMNGAAYSSAGANRKGVYIAGAVTTTGSGTITVNGTGTGAANAGFSNIGVWIVNSGSLTTQNGLLSISGIDQTTGTGSSWGVYISPAGSSFAKTTGTGDINITGTARTASGGTAIAATVANAIQTTGSGNIVLKAAAGLTGVYAGVSNAIMTSSGNITIYSDNYSVGASTAISAAGTLAMAAYSNIGVSVGGGVGGTANIDNTSLGNVAAGTGYVFGSLVTGSGSVNTGDVTINTTRDFGAKNVSFIAGGNIALAGTLVKATGAGAAAYLLQANGNIANSASAGISATSGTINLTLTSDYDVSGGGNIALTTSGLLANGGTIALNSNGQSVSLSGTIGGATTINSSNGAVTIGVLDGTTAGAQNLTVNAGTATVTTTGAIGSTNKLNNLTINSYDIALGANLTGSGTLILKPAATSTEVRINDGTAGGTYTLSSTEVGYLVDGWSGIQIGNATGTGSMYIGPTTWVDPIAFFNNYRVGINAAITGTGNASVTFTVSNSGWINSNFSITTAGQNVTFNGAGVISGASNITTNGGNISATSVQISGAAPNATWSTSGGTITINNALSRNPSGGSTSAKTFTLNAGSGTITLSGTVNGDFALSATGSGITASSTWGGTEALGNVTLNGTASISLPSITTTAGKTINVTTTGAGRSITTSGALSVGAAGNISFTADDLILGGNLSGTGTLTLQPYAASRIVRVNSGTADGTNFNLSTAEVGYFVDGWSMINIGNSANSVTSYIGAATWRDPVTFRSSVGRIFYGATGTGNASFDFTGSTSAVDLYGDITTNGGTVNFANSNYLYVPPWGTTKTITTNGGNVVFNSTRMAGTDLVVNAGTGSVSFTNAVSGPYSLTVTASSMAFSNFVGSAAFPIATLSLTSASSLILPSIMASSIFIRTTGAASDITIASGKTITASGSGNAITLASGRNFINSSGSSAPFVLSGGGHSLVYSSNPAADTLGGMTGSFVRYGCTYGGSCPSGVSIPSSGNGFIYTYRPTLIVTPAATSVVYGDAASLTGYAYGVTGYLTGAAGSETGLDTLTGSLTGSSTYALGSSIGTYNIDYASGSLSSALGYLISYANNASALTVNKRTLSVSMTGSVNKVYDGTNVATLGASNYALGNFYGSDGSSVSVATTSGTYDDKTAVSGKTVSVTSLTLTGASSGNYQLATTSLSAMIGSITKKVLNIVGLAGISRVYDGTITAGLSGTASLSGAIGGDDVNLDALGSGVFADKDVGTGKAITVSGYTANGTDAANYDLVQPLGLSANVTQKDLTVTAGNRTVTYGTAVPATTVSYSGFVGGEDESVLDTAPVVTSNLSGIQNAGIYNGNYIVSGASDNNYSLVYVNGNLIVNPSTAKPRPTQSETMSSLPNTYVYESQNPDYFAGYGASPPLSQSLSHVTFEIGEDEHPENDPRFDLGESSYRHSNGSIVIIITPELARRFFLDERNF